MSNHEEDRHWEENRQQEEKKEEEKILISFLHNSSSSNIKNVIITGFGLFRDHQINPSWEAIRDGQLKINRSNINVITKQINVSYQDATAVKVLWEEYNPLLMVHLGLAAHESALRIEQLARHGPYIHDDTVGYAPDRDLRNYDDKTKKSSEENILLKSYSCKPCQFDCSKTCLNIDLVCDKMNQLFQSKQVVMPTRKSTDAGLYLCEYIYHRSLAVCDRAVFVHVPSIDNFQLHDIRTALNYTIEFLIDEALKFKHD